MTLLGALFVRSKSISSIEYPARWRCTGSGERRRLIGYYLT
jgi:hypothetical protein